MKKAIITCGLRIINALRLNKLVVWICVRLFRSKKIHIVQGRDAIAENSASIDKVCELLSDRQSKDIYKRCLEKRRMSNPNFTDVYMPFQYTVPELIHQAEGGECIVDGGAFDGDTVRIFTAFFNNIRHIHAFEMDRNNVALLEAGARTSQVKIDIYPYALHSEDTELRFFAKGFNSSLSDIGDTAVQAVKLDSFLQNKPVTYIKLDVEGAELDVLKGAQVMIKTQRPKLAVCIYHNAKDFWEIPLYIEQIAPGYRMYVRHHGLLWNETVLYCLPS